CALPTVQWGSGCVSGTPGVSTSAENSRQSLSRKSSTGKPSPRAAATAPALSSQAETTAPPAIRAAAVARPLAPRPNSATDVAPSVVTGIIGASSDLEG